LNDHTDSCRFCTLSRNGGTLRVLHESVDAGLSWRGTLFAKKVDNCSKLG